MLYKLADIFFIIFHSALVLFNLFGWIWKPTRRANLITLVLTGLSWFVLGIFYGIGYCPLTDWHWNILVKLGHTELPNSYIAYLLNRLIGITVENDLVDLLTFVFFVIALVISSVVNIKDVIRKKQNKSFSSS